MGKISKIEESKRIYQGYTPQRYLYNLETKGETRGVQISNIPTMRHVSDLTYDVQLTIMCTYTSFCHLDA